LASLALFLGWRRAAGLSALQATTNGLPTLAHARPQLQAELARARRYEHDVSFVVLKLEPLPVPIDAAASGDTALAWSKALRAVFTHLGPLVRRSLRENDITTHDPDGERFVLALPQTDPRGANTAGKRLQVFLRQRAAIRVRAGVACFPVDGLILDDLLDAASRQRRPSYAPEEV
jgi:GGDEF domain-containing protein